MPAAITDFSQFVDLRRMAGENDGAALKEVAGQFEALFIQTLLKNMREASLGDGLLGGGQSHKMYEGMLDQQLSLEMAAGKGLGIAEMLVRQLGGESPAAPVTAPAPHAPVAATGLGARTSPIPQPEAMAEGAAVTVANGRFDTPESFVEAVWPHVKRAAQKLGVEARAILAQAALETGWGKHVPESLGGQSSFNLFGIKADSRWNGDAVSKQTLEFRNGIPQQESARFRSYASVAESVEDYARFIQDNPRYAAVGESGATPEAFGSALSAAGYATDPDYAAKISRVAASERMDTLLSRLDGAEPLFEPAGAQAGP
ncbi:MAG: flagellar assembly peptidoglycan hydrolase FlgJ [Pseudomonadota bacterium]